MSRKGFTLVELLVVIGICATLVAILMPALNKARATAKQVQCGAHLQSLAQATLMYVNEFKGWFPDLHNASGMWGDNPVVVPYWYSRAARDWFSQNYRLSRPQFYCPANQDWNTDGNWNATSNAKNGSVWGYIYYCNDAWLSTKGKIAVTYAANVTAANKYPIFANRFTDNSALDFMWSDITRSYQPSGTPRGSFSTKNGSNHVIGYEITTSSVPLIPFGTGGQNIAYRDGHVEWTRQSAMARQWYWIDASSGDITRGWW